jgi:O-antigen ligase
VSLAGGLNGAALITAMVVVIGVEYILRRRLNVLEMPLAKPFLALVGLTALGIVIAPDPRLAFEYWTRLLSTFLLFVLALDQLQDPAQRSKLVMALLLAVPIPVLVGLYQLATGQGNTFTEGYNRILGTFVHPANFGSFLITLLPLCVAVFMHSKPSLSKLGLAVLSVLMLLCIVFTFTRIVWIAVVVVAMVIGAAKTRASFLVIPAVFLFVFMFVPSVQSRLQGSTDTSGYGSGAWRLNLWDEELSFTSTSSLPLGLGLGAVETLAGHPAHNEYVRIWVETGLTGSIAYLMLYSALARRALSNYRRARSSVNRNLILAFLAAGAAWFVIAFTDNLLNVLALQWYFWALAALALSIQPRPESVASPALRDAV